MICFTTVVRATDLENFMCSCAVLFYMENTQTDRLFLSGDNEDTTNKERTKSVRTDNMAIIALTDESDDNWALHINDSTFIITFEYVTRQKGMGFHCWSNGRVVVSIENKTNLDNKIREKLYKLSECN